MIYQRTINSETANMLAEAEGFSIIAETDTKTELLIENKIQKKEMKTLLTKYTKENPKITIESAYKEFFHSMFIALLNILKRNGNYKEIYIVEYKMEDMDELTLNASITFKIK